MTGEEASLGTVHRASQKLKRFLQPPYVAPFTEIDDPERPGLRPRSQTRDVRVPETRRIRDVPFEECFLTWAGGRFDRRTIFV
jgi:hypothetical protein